MCALQSRQRFLETQLTHTHAARIPFAFNENLTFIVIFPLFFSGTFSPHFCFVLFYPACRRCWVLFEFGLARAQMQLIECENRSGLPQEFAF